MNNAVVFFLTFNTAIGQLLNNQIWYNFDLVCASALSHRHPLLGPQVQNRVKF